jgi:hypothetical protein
MNWRRCFILTLSILAAASLSCHGPETRALNLKIAAESDKSSPTQGSLDTGTPKSEIEAKFLESSHSRESRVDKMLYEEELTTLADLVASFL